MQVATERSGQVMSYCKEEGKDRVIFVTKEDHEEPSKAASLLLDEEDDDEPGLINDDGSINWSCPCLGGMATGPCGPEFREAFSCFHYSTEEIKGSDCFEQFQAMQDCMAQYPSLYDTGKDEREEAAEELFPEEGKGDSKESDSKKAEDSGSKDEPSKDKSSSKESTKEKS